MWQVTNRTPFAAQGYFVRDREGVEQWVVAIRALFKIRADRLTEIAETQQAVRLAPEYAAAQDRYDWIATVAALLLAFAGGALSYVAVRPSFSARTQVERVVMGLLLAASLLAILTTIGIVASLLLTLVFH